MKRRPGARFIIRDPWAPGRDRTFGRRSGCGSLRNVLRDDAGNVNGRLNWRTVRFPDASRQIAPGAQSVSVEVPNHPCGQPESYEAQNLLHETSGCSGPKPFPTRLICRQWSKALAGPRERARSGNE